MAAAAAARGGGGGLTAAVTAAAAAGGKRSDSRNCTSRPTERDRSIRQCRTTELLRPTPRRTVGAPLRSHGPCHESSCVDRALRRRRLRPTGGAETAETAAAPAAEAGTGAETGGDWKDGDVINTIPAVGGRYESARALFESTRHDDGS